MSNVGTTPTLPPVSDETPSHTATHQWQSFEFRMRHRRAERCLLRAEMALEAGFEEDAREALDEAARLNSDNPKLATLRAELEARTASAMAAFHTAQQASRRQRTAVVAATLVLFLAIGASAFWITRMNAPVVTLPADVTTAPPATRPLDESPVPAAQTDAIATAGQVEAQPSPAQEPIGPPEARAAENDPAEKRAHETATNTPNTPQGARGTGPQLPAFNPQFAPPRPVALPPSRAGSEEARVASAPAPTGPVPSPPPSTAPVASAPAPTPPAPPPPVPEAPGATGVTPGSLDRMGERLSATNAPVVEKAATAPADRPVPPEDPAVREEPRVRAVLSRYEAAYSGLDAAAAQAVWPSVDGRSLARAFDTLQSQRVSLGRCSVQVQGARASADCNGTMTWTPKVGGGTQTASRRWQFELHNGNGTWQITRADVR